MSARTPLAEALAREVLASWGLEGARLLPVAHGHINDTLFVDGERSGERLVLQRLSPIFGAELQADLEVVTGELACAGLETPRLRRTGSGELFVRDRDGAIWRLWSYVEGETLLAADSPARCRAAGEILGRFHAALWDCPYQLRHRRLGVHDTRRHLAGLEAALAARRAHRRYAEVAPVARAILEAAARLELPEGLPERLVHGDPKISNVIFDAAGEARCLVDLDTVARMPIAVELGDALRSWCSPRGEEVEDELELAFARAALAGYATGLGPARAAARELAAIPQTTVVIAVELAARFCRDALEESYFGWDPARFPSASEHNLVRARSQLALARSIRARLAELGRCVAELWPQ